MLSAVSSPTALGRRCVPPAPGRSPSFTSGSAICAPFVATRKWQPSGSSSPPPIAVVCSAAMTGLGLDSNAAMSVRSVGSASIFGVLNSRMSAPPENALPAPVSTIASTFESASARSSPSSIAERTGWLMPFTGGLSSVMSAILPRAS